MIKIPFFGRGSEIKPIKPYADQIAEKEIEYAKIYLKSIKEQLDKNMRSIITRLEKIIDSIDEPSIKKNLYNILEQRIQSILPQRSLTLYDANRILTEAKEYILKQIEREDHAQVNERIRKQLVKAEQEIKGIIEEILEEDKKRREEQIKREGLFGREISRRKFLGLVGLGALAALILVFRNLIEKLGISLPQETPTPSPSPTETPTPTPAPTPPPTKTPTPTTTPTPTPEATPTPESTPTPEGFISRERIKEWADGAVERIINEIERQNPGVRIEGLKLELAFLDEARGHMVYEYSIKWIGKEEITINKNEMEEIGISVIGSYTFDVKDVYSEKTGKGAYFSLKSSNPLIYYMRLFGFWPRINYEIEGLSIKEFSVTKKTEEKEGKPVLQLEIRVDPKNPKVNPPFSTTSPEKNFPPEK